MPGKFLWAKTGWKSVFCKQFRFDIGLTREGFGEDRLDVDDFGTSNGRQLRRSSFSYKLNDLLAHFEEAESQAVLSFNLHRKISKDEKRTV